MLEQTGRQSVKSLVGRVDLLEARVSSIEGSMQAVQSDVATAKENTAEILAVLTAAKGVAGFVRKYGPHAATLMLGIAVSAGWISAETGHSISALFGLTG